MNGIALATCIVVLACDGRSTSEGRSELPGRAASPRAPAEVVTDSAQLGEIKLELLDTGAACALRFSGRVPGAHALVPRPPCYFVRDRGARPQTFSYPDVAVRSVLIVVGSAASDEVRKRWNLRPDVVCGEETQAVLLRRDQVEVTRAVRRGGVTCRDAGVDAKEFWAFAHDEQSDSASEGRGRAASLPIQRR